MSDDTGRPGEVPWQDARARLRSSALACGSCSRGPAWTGRWWHGGWATAAPSCMRSWMTGSAGRRSGTGWSSRWSGRAPEMTRMPSRHGVAPRRAGGCAQRAHPAGPPGSARRTTPTEGEGRVVAALQVVPAQLPADVDVFTGRSQELADLDRLLTGLPTQADAVGGSSTAVVISAVSGTRGWARPRWRCGGHTESEASSQTGSSTSTSAATTRTSHCRRDMCWPGSCAPWVCPGRRSPRRSTNGPPPTAACLTGSGS